MIKRSAAVQFGKYLTGGLFHRLELPLVQILGLPPKAQSQLIN